MKKIALCAMLFGLFAMALPAEAQVRTRWRLTFTNEKPERVVYESPTGEREVFWYVIYEVTNSTPVRVPILWDVTLHTDSGRDFQEDVIKMEKSYHERGRYYADSLVSPLVEQMVLIEYLKLGNKNRGMAIERIEEYKKDENKYMNRRELRAKRVLNPAEKVTGIAFFRDVDEVSDILELSVWGLIDPVRTEKAEGGRIHYDYTIEVLRLFYTFGGDEYDRHNDSVYYKTKGWQKEQIGPIADKETIEVLLKNIGSNDAPLRHGAIHVLRTILGKDFDYDPDKSPEENDRAIKDWREWWSRNKAYLTYDEDLNRYYRQEPKVPGATPIPD